MRNLRNYILVLVVLVVSACAHKELCIEHPHWVPVRVDADWGNFSELPVNMSVMFFPKDGSEILTIHNNNHHTARTKLPVNTYDVVVFNEHMSDFGSLGFRNMKNFATAEAYLTDQTQLKILKKSPDEEVMADPERLGVAVIKDYQVTQEMLDRYRSQLKAGQQTEENVMTVAPDDKVHQFEVRLRAKGLQYVHSMECTLSGLAGGHLFAEDMPSSDRVTHRLTDWQKVLTSDSEEGEGYLCGTCRSFGLPNDHTGEPDQNILKMSILLVDFLTVMEFEFQIGDRISAETTADGLVFTIDLDEHVVFPEVHPEENIGNGLVIDPGFDGDLWVEWKP